MEHENISCDALSTVVREYLQLWNRGCVAHLLSWIMIANKTHDNAKQVLNIRFFVDGELSPTEKICNVPQWFDWLNTHASIQTDVQKPLPNPLNLRHNIAEAASIGRVFLSIYFPIFRSKWWRLPDWKENLPYHDSFLHCENCHRYSDRIRIPVTHITPHTPLRAASLIALSLTSIFSTDIHRPMNYHANSPNIPSSPISPSKQKAPSFRQIENAVV